jgi:ABC-type phosphate transport system substrate-binding protein
MKLLSAATLLLLSETAESNCGPNGKLSAAGSTDVKPIAEDWAASYTKECPDIGVSVSGGGSSVGAKNVCGVDGNADIGMMARGWKDVEATLASDGYTYSCLIGDSKFIAAQLPVANDGVTVFAAADGPAAECLSIIGSDGLSIDALRWIYSSYGEAELLASGWDKTSVPNSDGDDSTRYWSELNSGCPQATINLGVPNPSSGTYSFFSDKVMKSGEAISEVDAFIAEGGDPEVITHVLGEKTSLGFVGYGLYAVVDGLVAVPVNGVEPTIESIAAGEYKDLSRYIYMNLRVTGALKDTIPYLEHGYEEPPLPGVVPLSDTEKAEMYSRLDELKTLISKKKKKKKKNKKKKNVSDSKFYWRGVEQEFVEAKGEDGDE